MKMRSIGRLRKEERELPYQPRPEFIPPHTHEAEPFPLPYPNPVGYSDHNRLLRRMFIVCVYAHACVLLIYSAGRYGIPSQAEHRVHIYDATTRRPQINRCELVHSCQYPRREDETESPLIHQAQLFTKDNQESSTS